MYMVREDFRLLRTYYLDDGFGLPNYGRILLHPLGFLRVKIFPIN